MHLYQYKEFQEKVERIYRMLREEVSQVLPYAKIEHIGSSSVPGSLSKGDVDVYVGVPSVKFDDAIKALKEIGFREKKDTFRSHELCMLITDKFNHDVAIQVIAAGSQFEHFLHFKELLLSNPELVQKYNQIKVSAKDLPPSEYRSLKAKFIEETLSKGSKGS